MAVGDDIDLCQLMGDGGLENASCGKARAALSAPKGRSRRSRERIIRHRVPKNTWSPDHGAAVPSVGESAADRSPGHGSGKVIVNKDRQTAAPKRRSNRQRRQCLNVGDNIDDDWALRLNRSGDRVAKLVWFFDADAERANLLGHAGKINGAEGP